MGNCIRNIIRNAIKTNNDIKNIVLMPFNGIFEYSLCKNTKHHYFTVEKNGINIKHERLHYMSPDLSQWPMSLDLDLIICNDIIQQIDISHACSRNMHIPLIIVHHQTAPSFVKKEDMKILLENYSKAVRISTHEHINKSWYANFPIIPYGFEKIELFSNQNKKSLIICELTPGITPVIQGLQARLKESLTIINLLTNPSIEIIGKALQEHDIYISITNDNTLNMFMLIAMNYGKVILSGSNNIDNTILKDGENCYLVNNIDTIIKHINSTIPSFIGRNAALTIQKYFPVSNFTNKWEELIGTLTHRAFI